VFVNNDKESVNETDKTKTAKTRQKHRNDKQCQRKYVIKALYLYADLTHGIQGSPKSKPLSRIVIK